MKKARGLKKALAVVSLSELSTQPTRALLARLQKLRWCEDHPDLSDYTKEELQSVEDKIFFKSDEKWKTAYRDLKSILDEREHIENNL